MPATGPGQPGELISTEAFALPNVHGTVVKVAYHSQSVAGADITVTGVIAYPSGAAPAGGRPVLSFAHGTTGLADVCAPSRDAGSFGFLTPALNIFLDKGIVLAATDYEGLGTPGRHPYLVGASEGRGVLDIVRAARQIPDAQASDKVVLWGHSQGGHAALFAQQIAPTWAPELQVLGAVAGAPATELPQIAQLAGVAFFGILLVAGFQAAYPELDLHDVLTDEAVARIGVVDTECTSDARAAFGLTAAEAQKADPMSVPAWAARVTENDPGHVRTDTPLFIYQGSADEVIPVAASDRLFKRLCGLGQTAERKVYDGQTHTGVLLAAFLDIARWMDARIAGEPATNGCATP